MATRRLHIRKIREILRLKWQLDKSNRETVRSLGLSPSSVSAAVNRAKAAKLDLEHAQSLTDDELEARLYSARKSSTRSARCPIRVRHRGNPQALCTQKRAPDSSRSRHLGYSLSVLCFNYLTLSRTPFVTAALTTLLLAPTGCQRILGLEELSLPSDAGAETPDAVVADAAPTADNLCEWDHSRKITIDNSSMTGTDPLDGVPVLVHLTDQDIDHNDTGPAVEALRFHSLTGEPLAHEVEQWRATGDSYVWVRVPQILPDADNAFFMSYGHEDPPPAIGDTGVWDETFAAVWHFDDDGKDSSGNGNQGTVYGDQMFHEDSPTDSALRFDGNDDYMAADSDPTLDDLNAFTYTAWINATGFDNRHLFSKRAGHRELLLQDSSGLIVRGCVVMSGDNACSDSMPDLLATDEWQFVAMTFDADDDKVLRLYINGDEAIYGEQITGTGTSDPDNGNRQNIGRRSTNNRYFPGSVDEVRIANVARSADWMAVQHESMLGTLLTIEDESVPELCQ